MLRKILLSLILILAVGCEEKSIKNGVYSGVIIDDISNEKIKTKIILSNDSFEYIDIAYKTTNYYSRVSEKNKNDKDIIFYTAKIKELKGYLGLKQTNENALVVYSIMTEKFMQELKSFILAYRMGLADAESFNELIDIYAVDINKPSIFEKVEE